MTKVLKSRVNVSGNKEAMQASLAALNEPDSNKAAEIMVQGEAYLKVNTDSVDTSSTKTFCRPLNISLERAATLFSADRKKLKEETKKS
jgi:hypothetical protein